MSAYIVDKNTIDRVLTLIQRNTEFFLGERPEKFGQALWDMNAQAVAYRYSEPPEWQTYDRYEPVEDSDTQCYKALRCLIYQCGEGKYNRHPLFHFLEELNERFWKLEQDPAYRNAEWG